MKMFLKKITNNALVKLITIFLTVVVFLAIVFNGCEAFDRYDGDLLDEYDEYGDRTENVQNHFNKENVNDIDGTGTQNEYYSDKDQENSSEENDFKTDLIVGTDKAIDNSGAKTEIKAEEVPIEVYYQDKEGFLIPVTRRIPKQLSIAKAAINALIDTPINREEVAYFGLYPVLPQETEFTINVKGSLAIIDFNNKALEHGSKILEQNFVNAVVYTLTQFETINEVRILINGYIQQVLKYGTDISGILSRQRVLVNNLHKETGIVLKAGVDKIDIYLLKTNKDEIFVVPVSVECFDLYENSKQEEIIRNLSLGYQGKELFSEVPNDLKLIGSSISGGLLTINLGIEISDYGGTQRELGMVNQILYSMKQIEDVSEVKFLINGKAENFIEGTDISRSIPIPLVINDIVDVDVGI